MHIILTGATGTVGAAVLDYCLASPKITHLSILSRRLFALPVGDNVDTAKAQIILHEDFTSYPDGLLSKLSGADALIWALGIGQNEVSKTEYIRITYDYPLAAAKAFAGLSNRGQFNFVYVSGEGADPTEKTFTLFGKIKGRTEKDLLALPSTDPYSTLRIFNVRPGLVDPPKFHRPRPMAKKIFLDSALAPAMRLFVPSQVSPTGELSKVLVDLATGDGNPLEGAGIEAEGRTLRNSAVRRLAAS